MTPMVRSGLLFFVSVLGAHALAFATLHRLPDPAVAALGFGSAQPSARAAFDEARPNRPYWTVLSDLARGELGVTLDGTSVRSDLTTAGAASAPRLLGALLVIILLVGAVAFAHRRLLTMLAYVGTLVAFLPPFVVPFVGLGAVLLLDWAGTGASDLVAILCLGLPAGALAAAQTAGITRRNLEAPFAITQRSIGMSPTRQRVRLLANLLLELSPTLEKLVVGLVTALLFVEPIFGQSGLGSLMLRAIRRSDADMILALVLATSILINLLRLSGVGIRQAFGAQRL